jgi:hypothetical protein
MGSSSRAEAHGAFAPRRGAFLNHSRIYEEGRLPRGSTPLVRRGFESGFSCEHRCPWHFLLLWGQTPHLDRLRGLLSLEGFWESRERITLGVPSLVGNHPSPGQALEDFLPSGGIAHLTESLRHFKDRTEKLLSEEHPYLD